MAFWRWLWDMLIPWRVTNCALKKKNPFLAPTICSGETVYGASIPYREPAGSAAEGCVKLSGCNGFSRYIPMVACGWPGQLDVLNDDVFLMKVEDHVIMKIEECNLVLRIYTHIYIYIYIYTFVFIYIGLWLYVYTYCIHECGDYWLIHDMTMVPMEFGYSIWIVLDFGETFWSSLLTNHWQNHLGTLPTRWTLSRMTHPKRPFSGRGDVFFLECGAVLIPRWPSSGRDDSSHFRDEPGGYITNFHHFAQPLSKDLLMVRF